MYIIPIDHNTSLKKKTKILQFKNLQATGKWKPDVVLQKSYLH